MGDLMQKGQSWLASQILQHMSRPVTYCRDEIQVELQATIGTSFYEQQVDDGAVFKSQVRDYLIGTDLLLQSAIASLPRRGDQIIETDQNRVFIYELMSLGNGPPWRYSDPFRLKLRIHTKLVETLP